MIDALAGIGISVNTIQSLKPEDQFKLIAEGISQIADPAAKTTAAMDILGKSGSQLLPMFMQGSKGIEAMQKHARELGLTMRDKDARAATLLGDTWTDLLKVMEKGVFVIGASLAPIWEMFFLEEKSGQSNINQVLFDCAKHKGKK